MRDPFIKVVHLAPVTPIIGERTAGQVIIDGTGDNGVNIYDSSVVANGSDIVGNVTIYESSISNCSISGDVNGAGVNIGNSSTVSGGTISGDAQIGDSVVSGSPVISGSTSIYSSTISGSAQVLDSASLYDVTISGDYVVSGTTSLSGGSYS